MTSRPFAGMTRIRFKGWSPGHQDDLSWLPPAPLGDGRNMRQYDQSCKNEDYEPLLSPLAAAVVPVPVPGLGTGTCGTSHAARASRLRR